jgi:glycosyltransferase involved in cell wall biosynthesis
MNGLYLALLDLEALSGYKQKLFGQIKAFHEAGINMEIISLGSEPQVMLTNPNVGAALSEVLVTFKRIPFNNRIQIFLAAAKYIKKNKSSVIYIRHFLTDPLFILFLAYIKLTTKKIVVLSEVPTYPYDHIKEFTASFKSRLMLFVDQICRTSLRCLFSRIISIGYSADIFRIKTISIGNGIDVSHYKLRDNPRNSASRLKIIGVGYLKEYHGYDRLLETVKKSLLSNNQTSAIEFHIVSPTTPALIRLRREVEMANLSSHFIFHGHKVGRELDEVFEQCQLAIASLAWHRVGVERHSNLKTREYMARGIPFLYAGIDDQLPDDFEYANRVSSDEMPIDVEALLKFANQMSLDERCSAEMRNYAVQRMSWSVALLPVIEYIKSEYCYD